MTYDPNEPRDEHGRWGSGSGEGVSDTHLSGIQIQLRDPANMEHADLVAGIAASVAKDLGFDPKMIRISDEEKTFELNGKTLPYAGAAVLTDPVRGTASPDAGHITLYTGHVSEQTAAGVTAHEIEHQKFQAFFGDYRREFEAMQTDADYGKRSTWVRDETGTSNVTQSGPGGDYKVRREPGFMNPNGTLNEPYASKYPAYQAFTQAMMPGTDKFAKSDGVTGYSREYWKAYAAGTISSHFAYHETLAEISRLKYEKQPLANFVTKNVKVGKETAQVTTHSKKLQPEWTALYRAVGENWKRRSK